MLVQLLGERHIDARMIPSHAVSREEIASLDLAGIGVIAVSYLELSGSPANLRYLVRRLRDRAPGARIVLGLWPQGEAALSDAQIQRGLGADRYVGSLSGALEAIVSFGSDLTDARETAA